MKTTLLIIAIAGILFFAYRKVADYHFKKGLEAAQGKYMKILSESDEPIIGTRESERQIKARESQVFFGTGTLKPMPHDE